MSEQEVDVDKFRSSIRDLGEAEKIYIADTPGAEISEGVSIEMQNKLRVFGQRLARNIMDGQAIFDDIEAKCPGQTSADDCNYPEQ